MKYKLETIPVWDALHAGPDCPFCLLLKQSERRYIDFYLGSSVMNPETRVKVNTTGFCPDHYAMLAAEPRPQGLALISHTHLLETRKALQSVQESLKGLDKPRKAKKLIEQVRQVLGSRDSGCLICESLDMTFKRYAFTYVYLWGSDPEFREAVAGSKGICLHHYPEVLAMASEALDAPHQAEFIRSMAALMESRLDTITDDVHWMTQMYKSENRDKDWKGCQDAHKRSIGCETGFRIPSKGK